jgi:hypothetical protein
MESKVSRQVRVDTDTFFPGNNVCERERKPSVSKRQDVKILESERENVNKKEHIEILWLFAL